MSVPATTATAAAAANANASESTSVSASTVVDTNDDTSEMSHVQMTFLRDVTVEDGVTLTPLLPVTKTWEVYTATGWGSTMNLKCVAANAMPEIVNKTFPVPPARPGSKVLISVVFTVPEYADKEIKIVFTPFEGDKPIDYKLWAQFRTHPFQSTPQPAPEDTASESASAKELANALVSASGPAQLDAVIQVRKRLSRNDAGQITEELLAVPEFLPALCGLLRPDQDAPVKFESLWAVTNIASTDHTEVVTNNTLGVDAIPLIADCLNCEEDAILEQATWALGNIAGHNSSLRDRILALDILPGIMRGAQHTKTSIRECAVWTISNLLRGNPRVAIDKALPLVQIVGRVLATCKDKSDDNAILKDCLWGLSYALNTNATDVQAILEHLAVDITALATAKMSPNSASLAVPCLRILGAIAGGSDQHTQLLLDNNFLLLAKGMLQESARKKVRDETLFALSNVSAGAFEQARAVLSVPGLVGLVIQNMSGSRLKNASWVIANLATTCPEHCTGEVAEALAKVVRKDWGVTHKHCLDGLCDLLKKVPGFASVIDYSEIPHTRQTSRLRTVLELAHRLNTFTTAAFADSDSTSSSSSEPGLRAAEADSDSSSSSSSTSPRTVNPESSADDSAVGGADADVSQAMGQVADILNKFATTQQDKTRQEAEQLERCRQQLSSSQAEVAHLRALVEQLTARNTTLSERNQTLETEARESKARREQAAALCKQLAGVL